MKNIIIITMLLLLVGCQTAEQKTKAKLNSYKIGHIELADCSWQDIFNDLEKDSGIRFQLEMPEAVKIKKFPKSSPTSITDIFDNISLQMFLDNIVYASAGTYQYKVVEDTVIIIIKENK